MNPCDSTSSAAAVVKAADRMVTGLAREEVAKSGQWQLRVRIPPHSLSRLHHHHTPPAVHGGKASAAGSLRGGLLCLHRYPRRCCCRSTAPGAPNSWATKVSHAPQLCTCQTRHSSTRVSSCCTGDHHHRCLHLIMLFLHWLAWQQRQEQQCKSTPIHSSSQQQEESPPWHGPASA